MANRYIYSIYKAVYDCDMDQNDFFSRLKMQKLIYLLQELGVSAGDYRFTWYKHGPYSQALLFDVYNSSYSSVNFSPATSSKLEALKNLLNKTVSYPPETWAECLASIRYIKNNADYGTSDDQILKTLVKKKPHLNIQNDNENALNAINILFPQSSENC